MKTQIVITGVMIAVVCGDWAARGQATATEVPRDPAMASRGLADLNFEKATRVIGMEIKDSQGQKLGRVKDLAIDLHNGRIVEIIAGTGGVMGIDEFLTAVPPQQFGWNGKTLQLNQSRAQFKSAPKFKMADWDSNEHEAGVAEVYHYYSQTPYFEAASAPTAANHVDKVALATGASPNEPTPIRLGDVERASKLIGATTRNPQNEKVGRIENLAVDLPAGRVVEVIVASGGFLGLGDELSAVPPQAFHPGIHPDTLTLDTTREALTSAPHFKAGQWDINNRQQVETVYRVYNVAPYFTENSADNTSQNVRDRAQDAVTPLNQGTSAADMATTREIRKRILKRHELSADAHNVKVITRDGHVILRGPVESENEKRAVAEIATKVASPANVEDQLEVAKPSPTSSVK